MVEANLILEKYTEIDSGVFCNKIYLQTFKPNSVVVLWSWLSED